MNKYQPFLHYSTNDIYFTWGNDFILHEHTSPLIEHFLISGFPFNVHRGIIDEKHKLESNDKFSIALFDNGFNNFAPYSKSMMEHYYEPFLKWLIEDETIRIIVKSKRPDLIKNLNNIYGLYQRALGTGRLIRLSNEEGRFPTDASKFADIAIGIGISSAVIEAVIHGCRGIHCDMTGFKFHNYYKIGYNKLVFDDINILIDTLKLFKIDKSKFGDLGDWTDFIKNIDPYRDGKGDKRIGKYIESLAECFSKGGSKEEAIQYANKKFELAWGPDKIIPNTIHDQGC
jgi:hypothetical protein